MAELWENIKVFFKDFVTENYKIYLEALLVLIVGIIIVKLLTKAIKAILNKSTMDKITQSFLVSILRVGLNLLLVLIIAQTLGIPMTGIIALLSAAGLAISLSLQDSLSNLANGIVIISTKPFKEDDFVSINGVEGRVQEIRILNTTLVTVDNRIVVLPNSQIVKNSLINYSTQPQRRVQFDFSVAYESDTEKVKSIILSVMKSNGKVRLDPAPFVALKTLNSSSIDFFAYCWCDTEDYWDVYYYVVDQTFNEFKRNNICIPFNQMEVRLRQDEVSMPYIEMELPKRKEKVRVKKSKGIFDDFTKPFENLTKKQIKQKEKELKQQSTEQNDEDKKL